VQKFAHLPSALVLAAGTFFGGASAVWATSCSGTLSGTVNDDVTVPRNSTCTIQYAAVAGDVRVEQGATLLVEGYLEPSSIRGSVQAHNCASAFLRGNVTVGGNFEIRNCTDSAASGFQGPGVVINGSFQCQDNQGPCDAWLGKVGGSVRLRDSSSNAASDISLVDVGGDIKCEHNKVAPTHNHGPNWVGGHLHGQCSSSQGFAAVGTSIVAPGTSPSPGTACANLMFLTNFPVPNTVITSATDTPATSTLPERCIVNGIVNSRISPVDGCGLGDSFQVQLPLASAWNGRLMLQGGGGTEGSVPAATGSAGTLSPAIAHGFAVASQDGGHENLLLKLCGTKNNNEFFLDPEGVIDNSYQSIQVTTLNAKYLVDAYYGQGPNHSYWVGCSTGGRQGMVMSQNFPQYFDGIVAGDPVYELEDLQGLTELWSVQQIFNLYNATPSLAPITYVPGPSPEAPQAILYPAFPTSDQALFTTAILQACDALDGVADGVIDNLPACQAKFDPATATYVSGGTTLPLQCPGVKNSTCLSPEQIQAVKNINQGPRTNSGQPIQAPAGKVAPDHSDPTAQGYAYDGGWMAAAGIPARTIGSPTSPPGDYGLGLTIATYAFISPPDPTFDPLTFNFTTDLGRLNPSTPEVTASTSLDISRFINYGHKIIWYHGLSDPGPPVLGTLVYYNAMANQNGGLEAAQSFSRFYAIPNMNHCGGGPSTDQFDMLTPLVQWVENGVPPGPIVASGTNFTGLWQVPAGAPTTRSRPVCPYPQQARYIGPTSGANFPSGLGVAANYTCIAPRHDHEHRPPFREDTQPSGRDDDRDDD